VELDDSACSWLGTHPDRERMRVASGDAADETTTEAAADLAEAAAPLAGWVNNAARKPAERASAGASWSI